MEGVLLLVRCVCGGLLVLVRCVCGECIGEMCVWRVY